MLGRGFHTLIKNVSLSSPIDVGCILNIVGKQELLEDPATISAIDEETEFNALVVREMCGLVKIEMFIM